MSARYNIKRWRADAALYPLTSAIVGVMHQSVLVRVVRLFGLAVIVWEVQRG